PRQKPRLRESRIHEEAGVVHEWLIGQDAEPLPSGPISPREHEGNRQRRHTLTLCKHSQLLWSEGCYAASQAQSVFARTKPNRKCRTEARAGRARACTAATARRAGR